MYACKGITYGCDGGTFALLVDGGGKGRLALTRSLVKDVEDMSVESKVSSWLVLTDRTGRWCCTE